MFPHTQWIVFVLFLSRFFSTFFGFQPFVCSIYQCRSLCSLVSFLKSDLGNCVPLSLIFFPAPNPASVPPNLSMLVNPMLSYRSLRFCLSFFHLFLLSVTHMMYFPWISIQVDLFVFSATSNLLYCVSNSFRLLLPFYTRIFIWYILEFLLLLKLQFCWNLYLFL